jgi:multicomponent Na+:H+ antiporter subunit A
MGVTVAVLSGFVLALAAPWLQRCAPRLTGWFLALFPVALVVYFARHIGEMTASAPLVITSPWVPSLGVTLSFYVDGLSRLFALVISGIGALIVVYAGGYLGGHAHLGRFYAYLLMFMSSMLGLVLAGNVLTLFAFWELTGLSSYLLIGFEHEREAARTAALQALLVTSGGGLALLAGLLLLGQAGGSLELETLLHQGKAVRAHGYYLPLLLLLLLGAFTKSAQVPFHFWLPGAMEAPTPVSAYLHSATMVKAGVYLLARLSPVLGGTEVWYSTVTAAGTATMLVGAWLALQQTDLKRLLAYSTVNALGLLTLLLGLRTPLATMAAMTFLLGHALYKGALFLVAGVIDHETGTRDVAQLGGLYRAMPVTTAAAGVAALSMAGLPPFWGFISKEIAYEATLEAPQAAWLCTGFAVLANVLLVAVAGIVGARPFFGPHRATPKQPHEAPFGLWLGPVLLAGLGLWSGLWPGMFADALVSPAAAAVLAQPVAMHLALWHGWNPTLALSVITLASGVYIYVRRHTLCQAVRRYAWIRRWGPAQWYSSALTGLNTVALAQTRVLQSGYLSAYLLTIIATVVSLVGYTLVQHEGLDNLVGWSDIRFYEAVLAGLILLATLATVRSRSRLGAIAALGVVGYGIALIFILFGAPDLAMTQFLVETLTVILFVLVFYHLPRFTVLSSRPARVRDALVALTAGGLMTVLVLVATHVTWFPTIASYFVESSLPLAHGRNVVNVILVDFRGLDTLGEITVLAIAAVGVYALLKLRPKA